MREANDASDVREPHDLDRFVQAQDDIFAQALSEIASGEKRSHWMWVVFPQLRGLGRREQSGFYGIRNVAEARGYLCDPVLGPRLTECAAAALGVEGRSAREIFGSPDDMKLRSSATLFAHVSPDGSVFHRLLDRYFDGEPDRRTLELLGVAPEGA